MIFYGRYKNEAGIFRPYISAELLSPSNEWMGIDLLIDTGADETFLDFSFIKKFKINIEEVKIKDDVGGIGGSGIPYFQLDSGLKLISSQGTKVFSGKINIFLDPYASEVPLLGRDVLDSFVVIFDKKQNRILFLDEQEQYELSISPI